MKLRGFVAVAASALVALTLAISEVLRRLLHLPDLEMLFLLAVMVAAFRYGRGPSLLAAALSPDPNMRPQTAEVMAYALDQLADILPGGQTFAPHPLPPGEGSVLRPAAPNPYGSPSTFISSLGIQSPPPYTPQSAGSLVSASQVSGGIAPALETPTSMLANYIPDAGYAPVAAKEGHSPLFYVWLAISGVALFFAFMMLAMWLAR